MQVFTLILMKLLMVKMDHTKSNIIDRMWVRDGKVYRIEQWVAESN